MPARWLLGKAGQIGRAGVIAEAVGPEGHIVLQQWLTYTFVMASGRQVAESGGSVSKIYTWLTCTGHTIVELTHV